MAVTVEVSGGVAVIRLAQPMIDAVAGTRAALPLLTGVDGLVLHGCPRSPHPTAHFKAQVLTAPAERRAHVRRLRALRDELVAFPAPVVAAIGGSAFGDMAELVMACRHRVLAAGCDIVAVTGTGVLRGRRVPADEALRTGLVDRVVEPGAVLAAAVGLATAARVPAPLVGSGVR
ncbi:hypothetical protein [Saccharothrix obliqua]|uniref:hypothetical protein n=1 Tax=Saccharothrix obliqua TaxID=2861747 RepID=UPI001C5E01BA|nr:hypothetical protein [Saccharothrix obliqua]MBW4721048.1 hypothetical protein [Saccharothrix obliqua]